MIGLASTDFIIDNRVEMCVCPDLYSLLAGLLHREPTERMTLEELLHEPWIRQPINLAEYSWSEVFPCDHGKRPLSYTQTCGLGSAFILEYSAHLGEKRQHSLACHRQNMPVQQVGRSTSKMLSIWMPYFSLCKSNDILNMTEI